MKRFKPGFIIIISIILLTGCTNNMANNEVNKEIKKEFIDIRQPAVAGQFYPSEAGQLADKINKYLSLVPEQKPDGRVVKAVMVPHAGYDFSAPVAAYSFNQLKGRRINTAVIICNAHAAHFNGIVIDGHDAWQTPLGLVEADKNLAGKLIKTDDTIYFNSEVHVRDHTLEVQLPFLQTVLKGDFKIVPILFGSNNSYEKLAQALADNLSDNDIVIISTDMSHYPAYEDANKVDQQTLEMIKKGDIEKLENHIKSVENRQIANEQTVLCGLDGVKTAMALRKQANWGEIKILKYANSGDAAVGDKESVVGYGAMVFLKAADGKQDTEEKSSAIDINVLSREQQIELLQIARQTVESFVKNRKTPEFTVNDKQLQKQEGAFVTIHKSGELRGCIGQIVPSEKPLWQVVRDMAVAACSEDHRFDPVSVKELNEIDYEISVLSAPKEINNWQEIELGRHGVIVQQGGRSGVFLPQVADETGWDLDEFLSQLCWQKAGLPPNCYKNKDVALKTFTAQVFSEIK